MKALHAIALAAILIPALGVAQKKKHNDVPPVFETAHTVYVEAADGDYSKPGLSDADRRAIEGVQDALKAWGRYALAVHPEQADLIFVVRKSRGSADAQNGPLGQTHPSSNAGPSRLPGQSGDSDAMGGAMQMGVEGDSLMVYTIVDGKRKGPIWTRELRGGLDAPSPILVQQVKSAVERAYPPDSPPVEPAS